MTEIDPRLRTELGHRAGQIDVTGDFATRAIEIETRAQKRRVATAALGSALALAVTAPLVYSAMTPEATAPLPASSTTAPVPTSSAPAPTTSAPAPTASATPTAIPTFDTGTKPLATALPKLGPATGTPDVPYAVDGVLHDGDREVPLPAKTSIHELALLDHGGALLRWGTETGYGSALVDADGKELASLEEYQSIVVNDDGSRLLVAGTDGILRVLDSKGGAVTEKKTAHTPAGLIGDLAFANAGDGANSIVWDITTGETRTIEGNISDVNAKRRIALVGEQHATPSPDKVCYSILDVDTLATRSRACGPLAPMGFSPQGTYLYGTGTFDGGGPLSLAVIRVDDGQVALRIDESIGVWGARMNEAENAVTVSASEGGAAAPTNNALVRCELSGDCTVVGDARKMPLIGGLTSHVWAVAEN